MKSSPEDVTTRTWSVGQVAARFDMPTNVLRHWEAEGLLTPRRDSADRRRYTRGDVARIAAIRRNQEAGMSLPQIRVLLDSGAPDRHAVLEDHVAELDRRMAEMRLSREMTLHALRCQAHDISTCPRFRAALADLLEGFE